MISIKRTILAIFIISTFVACQQKGKKWLKENQPTIEAYFPQDDFLITDSSYLSNHISILEEYQKDLATVNTKRLTEEEQRGLTALKAEVEEALYYYQLFYQQADYYQLCDYLRNGLAEPTIDYHKINDILIASDSFYIAAKQNLTNINLSSITPTVNQHALDFHWLNDTLITKTNESDASEGLKNDISMNAYKAQLHIKDYIGFMNSMYYNSMDTILTKK